MCIYTTVYFLSCIPEITMNVSICLISLLVFASLFMASAAISVLDLDKNEVQPNTKYYIYAVKSGPGGGLSLSSRNRTCPFNVMQENTKSANGFPVRFLSANKSDKAITLSTDINIVFNVATICVVSTVWRVGGVDEITGRRYVTSGGLSGRYGLQMVSNWFKLEKVESGYKIVFCPSDSCKVVCGNVGVFVENGRRWIGLSDVPLVVTFNKVT